MKGSKIFFFIRRIYHLTPQYKKKKALVERQLRETWGGYEQEMGDIVTIEEAKDSHGCQYQISNGEYLKFLESFFSARPISGNDAIMDVGCGKGGMLKFLGQYGFGMVAGLEYSEDLYHICLDNIKKSKMKATVILADAYVFEQYDAYNYFYLYNPFDEMIMSSFLSNLLKSIKRRKRKVYIIYANPICESVFDEKLWERIELLEKSGKHEVAVYVNK